MIGTAGHFGSDSSVLRSVELSQGQKLVRPMQFRGRLPEFRTDQLFGCRETTTGMRLSRESPTRSPAGKQAADRALPVRAMPAEPFVSNQTSPPAHTQQARSAPQQRDE